MGGIKAFIALIPPIAFYRLITQSPLNRFKPLGNKGFVDGGERP